MIGRRFVGTVLAILLGICLVTAAFGGGKSEAAKPGMDKVTLRTNWLFYGSHGIFFLGIDKGYYAAQGIDLVVRQGNGSGNAVRLVANKEDTFAYVSSATMMNLAAQNAPVISVMEVDAMGTDAVLARPDSGIKNFKDLVGKKVLTTAGAGVNTFFPVAAQNAGVDPNSIELVNVSENSLVASYLQGLAPAMLGGIDDKPAEIVAHGGDMPVEIPYSSYGVYQPGYSIAANTELVKSNPDLVRRFVKATVQSIQAAVADPDAAIQSLVRWAGGAAVDPKQARTVLDVTLSILYSPNNSDKVLGLNVAKDWDSAESLLQKYSGLKTDMPASQFYTNDFLK
ncbi:MAG: ABC transporter substrate-binding protein [Spirochaetia bacterium]